MIALASTPYNLCAYTVRRGLLTKAIFTRFEYTELHFEDTKNR